MPSEQTHPRDITRVWTTEPHRNNQIHTAAMVLDPKLQSEFDPFLFLAEDWFMQGTFDIHPHRGIETVTYVIEGTLNHFDNVFGEGELHPGDVQWMTAGRGVIHKEDPAPEEPVHSLQLWVNLPREHKMTEPRYQNLRSQDMPVRYEDGGMIRIFSGSSGGIQAHTKNYAPVTMVEISLEAGKSIQQDLPGEYSGFIYVLEGKGTFGTNEVKAQKGQAMQLGKATKDSLSEISIHAIVPLKALLYAGRPLHEPIVAYGPFVMNTKEEILQAFNDYQNGNFIK